MAHEILIGVNVTDPAVYAQYRAAIVPFLAKYGGEFICDVEVSKVLKAPTPAPINRMFTLRFRDKAAKEAFFGDPGYKSVKEKFFARAVSESSYLAAYDR